MPVNGIYGEHTLMGFHATNRKGFMPQQNNESSPQDLHDDQVDGPLDTDTGEYPLLKTLIDQLPDLIYVKDTKSRYLVANEATIRSLALASQDELHGRTDFDFHPLDMAEQYADDEQAILASGRSLVNREEPVIDQHTGHIRWVLATKVPFYDSQGNIAGLVGINRDITERKRIEAQLVTAHTELRETNDQLAQLNASKDKFFSIVSHDLRSPLTVLLGLSELIDENVTRYTPERLKLYTKELRDATEKLYALLENLLTWSRVQRNAMEYFPQDLDIADLAGEAIELFFLTAKQKSITLRNAIEPGFVVYADYAMLYTVLRNLVSNALKFTSSGGHIEISAHYRGEMIEVDVTDGGIGIPPEDLPKLFRIDTRYSRPGTDGEEGTGLGLILCKELIEKNHGEIWAESDVGQGTTFRFTLPKPLPSQSSRQEK
jgi:PAS domain S-box-containing protein